MNAEPQGDSAATTREPLRPERRTRKEVRGGAERAFGAEAGERTVRALEATGASGLFVAGDVSVEADVERALSTTTARFGRLDFAVNCAGEAGDMSDLEHADQEVWDRVMAVNTRGTWLAMRHEAGAMLVAGSGSIVNVSSIYGMVGRAAHHAYVASKHAIVGMTRSVGLELATRGVRVNALCAGVTRTPAMSRAERLVPQVVAALVDEHPMRRMATEEEIAGAALWLCSEAAGYVTGSPVAVDGGFLAA